jgi:hypothetical protein
MRICSAGRSSVNSLRSSSSLCEAKSRARQRPLVMPLRRYQVLGCGRKTDIMSKATARTWVPAGGASYPTISLFLKQKAVSFFAVSGLSEPCTEFF